jgi:hypothetical protein
MGNLALDYGDKFPFLIFIISYDLKVGL